MPKNRLGNFITLKCDKLFINLIFLCATGGNGSYYYFDYTVQRAKK